MDPDEYETCNVVEIEFITNSIMETLAKQRLVVTKKKPYKVGYEDLKLQVLPSAPKPLNNKPSVCMAYVNTIIENVTSFHKQLYAHMSRFIIDNRKPKMTEITYWLSESDKLQKDLEKSIEILDGLKSVVQGKARGQAVNAIKDYLKGIEVVLKIEQQISTNFKTANTYPNVKTLKNWRIQFRLGNEELFKLKLRIAKNPIPVSNLHWNIVASVGALNLYGGCMCTGGGAGAH
jgi:hypothetical protein